MVVNYHATPCNTMQYHAIPCKTMQYLAIPCKTMQYNAIPCNTMQYHASLITADGAYHCPVSSIMAIFFLQLHCLHLHLLQDLFHLLLANSHTLQFETIRSVIKQIRETFLKLHTVFGMNESLKLHVIFAHYVEYFELSWHTLLRCIH